MSTRAVSSWPRKSPNSGKGWQFCPVGICAVQLGKQFAPFGIDRFLNLACNVRMFFQNLLQGSLPFRRHLGRIILVVLVIALGAIVLRDGIGGKGNAAHAAAMARVEIFCGYSLCVTSFGNEPY